MSLIIPYDENLYNNCGGYISPSGVIYYVKTSHEDFCKEYIERLKANNVKDQLDLFYLWDNANHSIQNKSLSDFMVFALSFDKIEKVSKSIQTTSGIPHIRFYNYYLMDWNINVYPRKVFNPQTNSFEIISVNEFFSSDYDTDYSFEIDDIKKRTLIKERYNYFK